MKDALVGKTINKETGKLAQHYKCAKCKGNFPAANVVVDHVNPVVDTMVGFVDWNTYVERMFCEADGLQVLCKPCHSDKTAQERKERKK